MRNRRISVTKEIEFSAAHLLVGHPTCGVLHGHNYQVEVTVSRDTLREDGMVVDFTDLKRILREVTDPLDHSYLNQVIRQERTTAERLAVYLMDEMEQSLREMDPRLSVIRVVVHETQGSYATVEEVGHVG